MAASREYIKRGLTSYVFNQVTGPNNKTVQFQGEEDGRKVFGLYNEEGWWEREVYDIEEALDYIDA